MICTELAVHTLPEDKRDEARGILDDWKNGQDSAAAGLTGEAEALVGEGGEAVDPSLVDGLPPFSEAIPPADDGDMVARISYIALFVLCWFLMVFPILYDIIVTTVHMVVTFTPKANVIV